MSRGGPRSQPLQYDLDDVGGNGKALGLGCGLDLLGLGHRRKRLDSDCLLAHAGEYTELLRCCQELFHAQSPHRSDHDAAVLGDGVVAATDADRPTEPARVLDRGHLQPHVLHPRLRQLAYTSV